jgi:hypothetical protein
VTERAIPGQDRDCVVAGRRECPLRVPGQRFVDLDADHVRHAEPVGQQGGVELLDKQLQQILQAGPNT